jgi:transcriptional regulator with XRE-family HTH domain
MFVLSNMTTAQQLGSQLKAARESLGISLRTLGGKVGIPYNTISGFEAGISVPTADKLARLAVTLNIHFVEVDGCRFWISRIEPEAMLVPSTDQLKLEFNGEYAYSRASLKISPGRITVVFDGVKDQSPLAPSGSVPA